jgi:hypothetical protein
MYAQSSGECKNFLVENFGDRRKLTARADREDIEAATKTKPRRLEPFDSAQGGRLRNGSRE